MFRYTSPRSRLKIQIDYIISSCAALLLASFTAASRLSSLKVTKIQNQVTNSRNAHVKTTLFLRPSPHTLGVYFELLNSGEEREKRKE
jgi:hypothetical protein